LNSAVCGFNLELNMDPCEVDRYTQYYAAINPYMERTDVQVEGNAYLSRELVSAEALVILR
jgi:hypothetical protein